MSQEVSKSLVSGLYPQYHLGEGQLIFNTVPGLEQWSASRTPFTDGLHRVVEGWIAWILSKNACNHVLFPNTNLDRFQVHSQGWWQAPECQWWLLLGLHFFRSRSAETALAGCKKPPTTRCMTSVANAVWQECSNWLWTPSAVMTMSETLAALHWMHCLICTAALSGWPKFPQNHQVNIFCVLRIEQKSLLFPEPLTNTTVTWEFWWFLFTPINPSPFWPAVFSQGHWYCWWFRNPAITTVCMSVSNPANNGIFTTNLNWWV